MSQLSARTVTTGALMFILDPFFASGTRTTRVPPQP